MDASKLKFLTYDRPESVGHVYYFTYFNFLFVVEYSHETSSDGEGLDEILHELVDSKLEIVYLEDSNIWTSDREITLDAYRPE